MPAGASGEGEQCGVGRCGREARRSATAQARAKPGEEVGLQAASCPSYSAKSPSRRLPAQSWLSRAGCRVTEAASEVGLRFLSCVGGRRVSVVRARWVQFPGGDESAIARAENGEWFVNRLVWGANCSRIRSHPGLVTRTKPRRCGDPLSGPSSPPGGGGPSFGRKCPPPSPSRTGPRGTRASRGRSRAAPEGATGASKTSEVEQRADREAAEFLVPQAQLTNFIARVRPLYSKRKIRGSAATVGVHPGIVVGQLQHRGEIPFAHSRDSWRRFARYCGTRRSRMDGGIRPIFRDS